MRPRLGIVGPGRVGWALACAARGAGYQVTGIAGGAPPGRAALAAAVGARPLEEAAALDADLVLLSVPDAALGALAAELRSRRPTPLVHTAGALPAATLGVSRAGTFHPLRSFSGIPREVDLAGCGVAIEATDEPLEAALVALAVALRMLPLRIPPDGRPRYHAAAVLAGNAPAVLLEVARRQLAALGVEPQAAARALGGLLASVAENATLLGPAAALSGPVRRGDAATVERNLAALGESGDEEAAELYRVLGRAALKLAERSDDPPPSAALAAMRRLLGDGGERPT